MDHTHQTNDEQTKLWNGLAGRAWVDAQELLDQMFKPFEDLLVDAVSAGPEAGCSTSAAARAARRSPSRGCSERKAAALGIDISDPMIAAARARAEREGSPASFIRADARPTLSSPRAST